MCHVSQHKVRKKSPPCLEQSIFARPILSSASCTRRVVAKQDYHDLKPQNWPEYKTFYGRPEMETKKIMSPFGPVTVRVGFYDGYPFISTNMLLYPGDKKGLKGSYEEIFKVFANMKKKRKMMILIKK